MPKRRRSSATTQSQTPGKHIRFLDDFVEGAIDYATGIPGAGAGAHAVYDYLTAPPNYKMAPYVSAASAGRSRFVHRPRSSKKSRRVARQITNLSAIHEYRVVQAQRNSTTIVGRQLYAELGVDAGGTNPVTGNAAIGLLNFGDLQYIRNLIQGAPAVGTVGIRFVIPKAIASYDLTNSTTGNIDLWLYDFVPRRDVHTQTNSNVFPPNLAFYTGMTTTFQGGNITQAGSAQFAATDPACYIGAKPFDSSLFCSWYKIRKVKKVCLQPGQCYNHTVKIYPKKVFDDNSFYDTSVANVAASTLQLIQNLTVVTLAVFYTSAAHSTAGGNPPTTGLPAIDVVTTKRYFYAWGPAQLRTLNTYTDLPTVATVETVPVNTGTFGNIVNA